MGKGFFNHSSSNKKQLLDIDGNNLSISGGNTVQLPGGANFNGFFPNGYELILESRDFLQSDVGKLLILGGSSVELTMPNTMPFEVGDIIGINSVQSSNNYQPAYDKDKIFPNHYGAGFGEVLILQCEDFTSLGGIKMLVPISTNTIYDSKDNNVKTLYRYILDNLGNSILLPNGIQFLSPGEYEYTADMAGKFISIYNGAKLIKPIGGYPFQNGDLICISLNDTDEEGTFSLTNYDNIKLLNGEHIILYALDIGGGTIELIPFSAPIIQDGVDGGNNPIWKTANRYFYDNRSPYRTITLGTVTYEDINNAPVSSEIEISVGLPPSWTFIDKYIITISTFENFNSLEVSQIEEIKIGYQNKYIAFEEINDLSISDYLYVLSNNNGQVASSSGSSPVTLKINFDKGTSEMNPQNFTKGEITIKAIIGTIE